MKVLKSNKMLSLVVLAALFITVLSPLKTYAAEANTKDTEATINFKAGVLEILKAPNLDFGTDHEIASQTEVYPLVDTSTDPINITDLRGTNAGWKLLAKLGDFENGSTQTLNGAFITVDGQTVTPVDGNTATAPTPTEPAVITSGGSMVNLLTAATGTGMSGWESALTAANTNLTVLNGTALAGTSTATITWSLEDTP